MGLLLNPGFRKFQLSLNSEIYVDKSELLVHTNRLFDTSRRFICISRPRRFGKTMAAEMMAAYYGNSIGSSILFDQLKISQHSSYHEYLNQGNVLMINIQDFVSQTKTVYEMLALLQTSIIEELMSENPTFTFRNPENFIQVLSDVFYQSQKPFVILIDEWDCLFRIFKDDVNAQKEYLDFLRLFLKDKEYVGLAYMTGILPIKKYGTQSALNMFKEYSMTNPGRFLEHFGFTEDEVIILCDDYEADFSEVKNWYNGYFLDSSTPIYSPKSVVSSLEDRRIDNYWNKTETYEALRDYINLNFDGLKDKVTLLLSGENISINTHSFTNDMRTFSVADDVLTLLIHLGYLSYHFENKTVRIPNEEVKSEFFNAVRVLKWEHVINAAYASNKLLTAIWDFDCEAVAKGIEKVHEENTSILTFNDENSLSCVISLALYGAKDYYSIIREMPTGKGYADLVFIPRRKHQDKPAIVVELKWNATASGAIEQIKARNYPSALSEYEGNLLLVGINYDKSAKSYDCVIEATTL